MTLEGLRALVTGASRGIGAAVAEALLTRGAQVVLTGRDEAALGRLAERHPAGAHVVLGELSEPASRDAVVDRAIAALGGLDAMVASAGVARHCAFERMDERALRAQLEVNTIAPLMMIQRALPALRQGRGRVVLLGSTLAERPAPGTVAYTASKAALHASVRALAAELAPHVTVNAVAPGVVDTAMIRAVPAHVPAAEREERIAERVDALRALHPAGRLGTPREIADAVLFLLGAEWTTGTVLTVDGGLTARP